MTKFGRTMDQIQSQSQSGFGGILVVESRVCISYGRHQLLYASADTRSDKNKPTQPILSRWFRDHQWDQLRRFMGIATKDWSPRKAIVSINYDIFFKFLRDIFGKCPPKGLVRVLNCNRDKVVSNKNMLCFGYKYGPAPCNQGMTAQ